MPAIELQRAAATKGFADFEFGVDLEELEEVVRSPSSRDGTARSSALDRSASLPGRWCGLGDRGFGERSPFCVLDSAESRRPCSMVAELARVAPDLAQGGQRGGVVRDRLDRESADEKAGAAADVLRGEREWPDGRLGVVRDGDDGVRRRRSASACGGSQVRTGSVSVSYSIFRTRAPGSGQGGAG